MIKKNCLQCNMDFEVKNYRKDSAKFCSRSCSSSYYYDERLRDIDKSYMIGNIIRKGIKPTNAFKKGHIPFNKGTVGIMKKNKTSFVKGQKSNKIMEIGTIVIRTHKSKKRRWIKIENPSLWELYSVYLWKQQHGEIKKGNIIHHNNFNMLDDRVDNYSSLTRAEHINIHRVGMKGK